MYIYKYIYMYIYIYIYINIYIFIQTSRLSVSNTWNDMNHEKILVGKTNPDWLPNRLYTHIL